MDLALSGKAFVVADGTIGMGRGISEALLGEGAQVVAVYGFRHDEAERFLEANKDSHEQQRLFADSADIADESTYDGLFENVRDQFGRLHGLVNIPALKAEQELTLKNLGQITLVSAVAPVALIYHALDHFSPDGASVVNILPVLREAGAAGLPPARAVAYCGASRGYVETASRLMLEECRARNVRVNCIAPGPVSVLRPPEGDTGAEGRAAHAESGQERRTEFAGIASVVLFLLSPLSSHVTGQTIWVAEADVKRET
jgi:NAD(P)-dependent dehydrogenase (short-subunit alcohol dehydrogenase family)